MARRKDYPFNRRHIKSANKILFKPFDVASKLLYVCSNSSLSNNNDDLNIFTDGWGAQFPLKPKKHTLTNTILCLFFTCTIFIASILYLYFDWWLFPTLLMFFIIDLILLSSTAFPMLGNIKKCFIFNSLDSKEQIKTCKYISTIWIISLLVHVIFYLTSTIILKNVHREDFVSWIYNFDTDFFYLVLSWGRNSTQLATGISVVHLCVKFATIIYLLYVRINLNKIISSNKSFNATAKGIMSVDRFMLLNYFEKSEEESIINLANNCKLKCIKKEDILQCGFILKCTDGLEYKYLLNQYSKSIFKIIKDRDEIFNHICKEINSTLKEYNLKKHNN